MQAKSFSGTKPSRFHYFYRLVAVVSGLTVLHGLLLCAQSAVAPPLPVQAQSNRTQQPPVPPVTTTVIVEGGGADDFLTTDLNSGSLDNLSLAEVPVSATVVTRNMMNDQLSRLLSDVVKNDASIGEDYAPVGYYGDFVIRGFPIDLATGLAINGMVIAGEQDVPLENKERVEFIKGITGVETGVTSAGGTIDYVTKRPVPVKTIELATDHRGTAYGALDIGTWLGRRKRFGVRGNFAGEEIKSYVEDANGTRGVGAMAVDWSISERLQLKGDFEFQHKVQRSVAGYQLLGGTEVPSLKQVFPSVMLGDQRWSKPNTFDAFNTGARLSVSVSRSWNVYVAGSESRSVIDDNVIYPYGCYYESVCNQAGRPAPYFFAPDGTYDLYDYRSPGEVRSDALGEAVAYGEWKTGLVTHHLLVGGSLFHRSVELPGKPGPGDPGTVQDGPVYTYIGSENIFSREVSVPIESPVQQAGPSQLADFNRQSSGIIQDRVRLPGRVEITAGGRYASMKDFNFSGARGAWLPRYALTWSAVPGLMIYGSYSLMLSLGPQAPFWAENGNEFLAPFYTRQLEAGAKWEPGRRLLMTGSVFRMRAPFFYPKVDAADPTGASLLFVGEGHQIDDGVEANVQGKALSWMRVTASLAALKAVSDSTGTRAFDGKQVINVPRLRGTIFADLALPHAAQRWAGLRWTGIDLEHLHIEPGFSLSGRKAATRDDLVHVSSYSLIQLGAGYAAGGEQGHVSFHLYADNVLNKRYWKDTGANYGDTFLHLGAPATVRLSGEYRF